MYLQDKELEREFNRKMLEEDRADYVPHYNSDGFRHLKMPVISSDNPDVLQLQEWGLIPFWAKNDSDAAQMRKGTLNAKCETLFELKSFKDIAPKQRCLILVNGIFEPHHNNDGSVTYFHIRRRSRSAFAIGGIWNWWKNGENGQFHKSFSMITTPPTTLLAEIHNAKPRMPFFVPDNLMDIWLTKDTTVTDLKSMMLPYPDETDLEAWPVTRLINNKRNYSDIPEVIEKDTLYDVDVLF